MKKGVIVIALIFFLLAMGIAFSVNHKNKNINDNKVDKEVDDLLKENDVVSVIVVLKDNYDTLNEYSASELDDADEFDKKTMMIAKQQERVLAKLDKKDDLKLKSKFTSVNGFAGEVTKEGLEKLKKDPNVKKVYPNRPMRAFLGYIDNDRSTSLFWNLKTKQITSRQM